MNAPLSKIMWLWLPIIFMIIQSALELTLSHQALSNMLSEQGPHEAIQFFILIGALFFAAKCLIHINWTTQKWLGAWCAIAFLCCFYVAGEEVSWGQHVLQWSTPEYWATLNDQGETNLHNTSSWLDQKPRLLLLIGTLVGGLIIPALQKFKPGMLPQKFSIIYPPAMLGVIASSALIFTIIDKIDEALPDITILVRVSELIEIALFYFVMLYLIILYRRIASTKKEAA